MEQVERLAVSCTELAKQTYNVLLIGCRLEATVPSKQFRTNMSNKNFSLKTLAMLHLVVRDAPPVYEKPCIKHARQVL